MIPNGSTIDSGMAESFSDLLRLNSSPDQLPEQSSNL